MKPNHKFPIKLPQREILVSDIDEINIDYENEGVRAISSNATQSLSDEEEQLFSIQVDERNSCNEIKILDKAGHMYNCVECDDSLESDSIKHDSSMDSKTVQSCPICFELFKEKDVICCSKINSECKHLYHEQCMVQWLLKHDDCPMCRNKMFSDTV